MDDLFSRDEALGGTPEHRAQNLLQPGIDTSVANREAQAAIDTAVGASVSDEQAPPRL